MSAVSVSTELDVWNDRSAGAFARPSSAPRPATSMAGTDALSELLRLVRLTGAVFVQGELSAPFAVHTPCSSVLAATLMPHAEHLIEYHLVLEGRCWIRVDGEEPVPLDAGDLVMLPHGDAHLLASDPHLVVPTVDTTGMTLPPPGEIVEARAGGGGAVTRLACGYLAIERRPCRPLLDALPRVLRVDARESDLGGWLHTYLRLRAVDGVHARPGVEGVLSRLSELMFVEALRRYIDALPPQRSGWLAALRDPPVGRVLTLLHQAPARPWTVAALARAAHLSRSALAARFQALVGQPPMQYLTEWRLNFAAHRMRTCDRPLATIAEEVGYDSQAAFSRAFKRAFGLPPALWREQRQRGAAALPARVSG